MANDALLKEIRERFERCVDSWREIREEGSIDMKYIGGDPWDPKDRAERKAANRPCLTFQELTQYVDQRINDVRQNKRAIKVSPGDGQGTDEDTAELHASIIRTIEYNSKAQSAYITAFENALQRSYGYFRIGTRYVSEDSFEQELYIGRIPNPDTVYIDPDCKEADCSDARYAFLIEDYPHEVFKAKWPKADIHDFPAEYLTSYPHWIKEKTVQVAEYWKVKETPQTILMVGDPAQPEKISLEELPPGTKDGKTELILPDGNRIPILKRRKSAKLQIIQYITNGVDILEENEWDGKWIPIIPVYGKEIFVDSGSGSKRVLLSLVRFARNPQMFYCYLRTSEAETLAMVPKSPYVGYAGQFEGFETEWSTVNKVPWGYLQVKPIVDSVSNQILPLPQRQNFEPPIQAFELAAESAKRAIQNAMGMYNASVGRSDSAGKSGKAIQALDLQSDQGNFHFIDNYDRSLCHAGRILDDMIPKIYDTARKVSIRNPDESQTQVEINKPTTDPQTGKPVEHRVAQGAHNVTISTGPSYQSQREEAKDFALTIAAKPEIFAIIGDLLVKLQELGPIGDEIADRLTPPQFRKDQKEDPRAMMEKLAKADQMIQAMTQQLNKLTDELNMRKAELESKEKIESLKAEVELAKINAQLASRENIEMMKAEMAKIQQSIEALRAVEPSPVEAGAMQ